MGEQPTFAEQMKLHNMKWNKHLRENRKESQLPSKSEGCNERYGFRGNCDSQGKLGMCPSLAESLAVGFSRNHVSRETMYKNKLFLEHWLQILSRRQRNPRAMLLAHGAGGEKRESFSRRGEQDRSALFPESSKQQSCNCSGGTITTKYYLTEILTPRENGLPDPAKGGSTPAFAYHRAAIAPLPCSNLQLIS